MGEERNTREAKKRGPKVKNSDLKMKEIALEVKRKSKNQQITYSMLEKETGIGRNTWKRRLEHFIRELNQPILRDFENLDADEIYFPNIESVFEVYGNNKQKIINELHHFEILFQELYEERNLLKQQLNKLEGYEEEIVQYKKEIKDLKHQVGHYQTLYEKIMVSSVETQLRNKLGLKNNLLDFMGDVEVNSSLHNLSQHFPTVEEKDKNEEIVKGKNIDQLKQEFRNLF